MSRAVRLAACAAVSLAVLATPVVAMGEEAPTSGISAPAETVVDRAQFYEEAPEDGAALLSVDLNARVTPRTLSDEALYFSSYESGRNYDQGFSAGDGYHALGCYQLDNRYGLQSFLVACYNYDPATYGMFAWLRDASVDIASQAMYDASAGRLTDTGQRLQDGWHAAYAANPDGFSRLQDGWFYQEYMEPAISYLDRRGLNVSGRRDCIKGLVSGVQSLFGSGGWRRFVGGSFAGTDWPGAGLTGSMSDREFATTLCNYIVDHVAEFYPSQPQYHAGWQNRYRQELKDCLAFLTDEPSRYPADVNPNDWYVTSGAYDFVTSRGYMGGYGNGLFGPYDSLTRGQVVTVLWRMAGSPDASSTSFADVNYGDYYGKAIRWGRAVGVANGDGAVSGPQATFRPNDLVTREELATFFANYASRVDGRSTASTCVKLDAIDGATQASPWARTSLGWAVDQGLIAGTLDANGVRHLEPRSHAWRASMASMVMSYLS